jgi:hypothetical protein
MRQVTDVTLRNQIADRAQESLDHHQPRKYRIIVDREAILEEDDWYQIVVTTENDVRDREFYEAIADAEADLQDQNGHQYLLVPAVADS